MTDPLDPLFDRQPIRQRLQFNATFRRSPSAVAPLLFDRRITTLVNNCPGITIEGEVSVYPVTRKKRRHWHYRIDFTIMNESTMDDFETLKNEVYALFYELKPRGMGYDVTRVSEQ